MALPLSLSKIRFNPSFNFEAQNAAVVVVTSRSPLCCVTWNLDFERRL